jgi:molybdopterin-containing oxidoreductase family membrane subunit
MYHGTIWDYATYYGSFGLFFTLLFLFIRFLPVISITEMRELVLETQERAERQDAALGGANPGVP